MFPHLVISLVICVPLPGKHISLGICVPPPGKLICLFSPTSLQLLGSILFFFDKRKDRKEADFCDCHELRKLMTLYCQAAWMELCGLSLSESGGQHHMWVMLVRCQSSRCSERLLSGYLLSPNTKIFRYQNVRSGIWMVK